MAQESTILLVGGYGHVGKMIAAEIQRLDLGKVVIAGRDQEKARMTALEVDPSFAYTAFDIRHFGIHEKNTVDQSDVVIVCVDQVDTGFVEYCLLNSKLYIDITASSDFLRKIDSLNEVAIQGRSLAIVSVGLCPGAHQPGGGRSKSNISAGG